MTDRWQQLSARLDELFDLDAAAREDRLLAIAREDAELAIELRRALAADERSGVLDAGIARAAPTFMTRLADGTDAPSRAPTPVGTEIGHYKLLERVGSGGMGDVWRGERTGGDFEQQVAVKLIRPLLDSPALRERFARERRILARLDHPNIARLLDGGVSVDGVPWYAMEFVRGVPLVQYADEHGVDTRGRVELLLQVCDAVAHAQSLLVVHRDLKPSNILVDGQGRVRVLDFGIARLLDDSADLALTGTGVRVFSPAYAAPEQIRGETVGTAADVFALGAVLFELLTGEVPHPKRSASPERLLAGLADESAPHPSRTLRERSAQVTGNAARTTRNARDVGADLDLIVATALQPEAARRYAGAAQLGDDLRRWLDGRPIAAQSDTAGYRMRRFVTRHRLAVGSASAVLLALIAGLGMALWQANVARQHATRADAEAQRANAEATRATSEAKRAESEAETARAQVKRTKKVKDFFVQTLVQADPLQRAAAGPATVAEAFDAAIKRAETELADDPVLQADVFDDFGEIRAGQGRFDDALALLQRALAVAEKEYGPDHPAVAESLLNLGVVHDYRGDELAGAPLVERAVAILEKDDGGDPLVLGNALSALASVRQQQGKAEEMIALTRRAAEIYRVHGPDDPQYVMMLSNLAQLDMNAGKFDEAEKGFRETIARVESAFGPQSPHLWPNLFPLGTLAYQRGDYAEELKLQERALAVARHNYPQDHPWVGSSINEVGWIHAREGRLAQGEPMMREGIAMFERLGSPRAISSQRRLAIALQRNDRLPEAAAMMDAAWDGCQKRNLAQQQTCVVIRANRAQMMALAGRGAEALVEADAAIAALQPLGDGLVSERGQANQARAAALAALGRRDEAFALQDKVIADYTAAFGEAHQEVASARSARKRLEAIP